MPGHGIHVRVAKRNALRTPPVQYDTAMYLVVRAACVKLANVGGRLEGAPGLERIAVQIASGDAMLPVPSLSNTLFHGA